MSTGDSIFLIHWNSEEGAARLAELNAQGFRAVLGPAIGPECFCRMRELHPTAVVIDLSRMPSHGREVAVAMRNAKWSRTIPIVFAGGDPAKVAATRAKLPDAVYAEWCGIGDAIRGAICNAPEVPVRPSTMMGSYTATLLVKKLAIKPNSTVHLIGSPEGFTESLRDLPAGTVVRESSKGAADLRIWFVRTRAELDNGILAAARNSKSTPLWIAYPKKQSREYSDLTQQAVRETGIAAGMVDYKICAIDETWTALLFAAQK